MRLVWVMALLVAIAVAQRRSRNEAVERSEGGYKRGSRGPGAAFQSNTGLSSRKNGDGESAGSVKTKNTVQAGAKNRRGGDNKMASTFKDGRVHGVYNRGRARKNGRGGLVSGDEAGLRSCKDKLRAAARKRKSRRDLSASEVSELKRCFNTQFKGLQTTGSDNSGGIFANQPNGDNNNFRFGGRRGRKMAKAAADTQGCNGDNPLKCRTGNFKSDQIDGVITPDQAKNGQGGVFEGALKFDNKKGRKRGSETHRYEVICEESKRRRGKCEKLKPVILKDVRNQKYECKTEQVTRAYSRTVCCNKKKRCVGSKTNADGDVTIESANTQVGDGKCKTNGLPSRRRFDGTIAKRLDCNAGITPSRRKQDKSGATAKDMRAGLSDSKCYEYRKNGKRITIGKPRYEADRPTARSGFKSFDFPHCGTMTADITFSGFSSAEMKDIGKRLGIQVIVNASPVGQLKCTDNQACLAKKDANGDHNCYYCDLCNKRRNKGKLLESADSSFCTDDPGTRKKRFSARICPIDKDTEQKLCHVVSKKATDSYFKKKGDVDVKMMLYVRRTPQGPDESYLDYIAKEYKKTKSAGCVFGVCAKWLIVKNKLKLDRNLDPDGLLDLFNGKQRPRNREEEDMLLFEQYVKNENSKGELISCKTYVTNWSIFGNNLGKFADAATTAADLRGFLGRNSKCKNFISEMRRDQIAPLDIGAPK